MNNQHHDSSFDDFQEIKNREYELNRLFFSSYKYFYIFIFLVLPVIFNIIFNIIFHFNPSYALSLANSSDPVLNHLPLAREYISKRLLFTSVLGGTEVFILTFFLTRFNHYFIKSGAIILPLYSLFLNLLIPLVFGSILASFFKNNTALNLSLVVVQMLVYIFLIYFFFKFCTGSSLRNKLFFRSENKIENNNWTKKILNIEIFDVIKIFVIVIVGIGFFYLINNIFNIFNFHLLSFTKLNNSDNQQGINNLLESLGGKIILPFLIVIFAPIMEELATRQSPILSSIVDSDKIDSLCNDSVTTKSINGFKYNQLALFLVSTFFSIVYFANMHVQYSNFYDIKLYLAASLVFTGVYIIGNFNANYSIAVHGITNLITLILILK